MFELRCPNCGWTSQMTPEAQAAAVAEADRLGATHHVEHCPRCQWVIRVPVASLRVEAAPPAEAPVLLPSPEQPLLLEAEKPAAPRKRPARKPAARRAPAKKAAARKAPAKKSATKKPAAKKTTARKPTAKKSTTTKRKK